MLVQQGIEVVISEGVVKEVSQFKYLGSLLVTDAIGLGRR